MPYKARWNTATPGCVLFLLDQSNSMNESFGGNQTDAGETKAEALARVCNDTILALIDESREGSEYRDRLEIAIIGYGSGGEDGEDVVSLLPGPDAFIPINTLRINPIRSEQRQKKIYNPLTKSNQTVVEEVPIWVEPHAFGMTPTAKSIETIDPMVEKWCMQHPESFPPIIIHVTDAMATDKDPRPIAFNFMRHGTNDGRVIFCHCHLSTAQGQNLKFPHSKTSPAFPPDNMAEILYDMSSPLTDNMRAFAEAKRVKNPCPEGSRCYIFNGSPDDLAQLIEVGSSGPRGFDR